ncbi:MAG: cation diffusion facilitator family transporter [candidate division Zixibacteria bacterium]|nr:cation diffusion facilitator family transporter [candidate division Zixibacteria bacterium]
MAEKDKNIRANLAVTRLAVASNTALTVGKVVAGVAMSSAAVFAEGLHSGVDLVAALMAFWAVRRARRPADADHAFGHGKYDALSGAVEGLLIFGAAFFIIVEGCRKIIARGEVERLGLGAAVMAASALINFVVSARLFAVARRTGSVAVEADGHHLRTDVWTSLGVLVGIGLIRITDVHLLDPLAAFVVAALILVTAWRITRKSFGDLLDRCLPAEEEKRIAEIIKKDHPHWLEYHRLRTRRAGGQRHVDLHLVTCRDIPLELAHSLTEDLEDDIRREFASAEIVTHVEACEKAEADCDDGCPMYDIRMKIITRVGRR